MYQNFKSAEDLEMRRLSSDFFQKQKDNKYFERKDRKVPPQKNHPLLKKTRRIPFGRSENMYCLVVTGRKDPLILTFKK